jgi:hypothetical protein
VVPHAKVCFVQDAGSANGSILTVKSDRRAKVSLAGDGKYQVTPDDRLRLANVRAQLRWIETHGVS